MGGKGASLNLVRWFAFSQVPSQSPETTLPNNSEQREKGLTYTLQNVHSGKASHTLTPWGYYCFAYMRSLSGMPHYGFKPKL